MHPLRRLAAAPVFAAFAATTLALGIGATTALYAIAEAVLFRPIDIREAERVVNIYHHDPTRVTAGHQMALSWLDARDIRATSTTLSDVMFWSRFSVPLTGRGSFTPLLGELVSGNYFTFVGARPLLGRTLQPADDEPGAPAVVVISESLWRGSFGQDPSVVGQTVRVGQESCEIVGVMPAAFRGVDIPTVMPTRIWAPLALAQRLGTLQTADDWNDRERRWVLAKGRLEAGRSVEDARREIESIGQRLDETFPIGSEERRPRGRPEDVRLFAVTRALDLRAHETVDPVAVPTAKAVLAAVGLVLLVVCTNLANLLLARATRRQHEVAVRRALGATRLQVIGTLIQDSVLLTIIGGLGGVLFARWLIWLVSTTLPLGTGGLAISIAPRMTPAALGVALAATSAAMIVFAIIPAWHTTKGGLRALLDAQTGGAVGRWRGRRLLIATQVCISATLLVPGALLLKEAVTKIQGDPGFDLDRLVAAQIDFSMLDRGAHNDGADARNVRRNEIIGEAIEQVRTIRGVAGATFATRLPVYFSTAPFARVSREPVAATEINRAVAERRILAAYETVADEAVFDTLGITLVWGRGFDATEVREAAPVIVVSRALSISLFGSEATVGRTVFLGTEPYEVIGIVADTDSSSLGRRTTPSIYRPGQPDLSRPAVLAAAAAVDPDAVLRDMRSVLRDIDPDLPVVEITTGQLIAQQQTLFDRVGAELVSLLGGFALVLALTGLAGLQSFVVSSRRREIGVRLALGADPRRIMRLVIADGLRPVLYGGAVGLLAGMGLSYLVGAYFYRLPGLDWLGIVTVGLLLVPAAVAACYVPARRAASVDPNVTLREL